MKNIHLLALSRRVVVALSLSAFAWGAAGATGANSAKFIFISHAPDSDTWWNTVKNSLKHASEDFGVEVEYRNPHNGDIKDMARLIDEAAAQKPDGIITTIADYDVLKSHLSNVAIDQKIPLITVNSGTHQQSESVGAILHIGQPEITAGKRAGAKAAQSGIKSFVCLNHYSNNPASHERCKGFAEGLGLPTAEELKLTGDEKQIEGQIIDYFASHQNVEAILALGPLSANPALAGIRAGKLGKPPFFATFDLSPSITDGIKKNQISFAIDQQPYLQGYLAVGLLAEWRKNGWKDLQMVKFVLYSKKELHARMSKYGLTLLTFGERHIDSGPGLVTRSTVDKVETYSGMYR